MIGDEVLNIIMKSAFVFNMLCGAIAFILAVFKS